MPKQQLSLFQLLLLFPSFINIGIVENATNNNCSIVSKTCLYGMQKVRLNVLNYIFMNSLQKDKSTAFDNLLDWSPDSDFSQQQNEQAATVQSEPILVQRIIKDVATVDRQILMEIQKGINIEDKDQLSYVDVPIVSQAKKFPSPADVIALGDQLVAQLVIKSQKENGISPIQYGQGSSNAKIGLENGQLDNEKFLNFLLDNMAESDFSLLYTIWRDHSIEFMKWFEGIITNWNIYQYIFDKKFEKFLNLCASKIETQPMFKLVYPGIDKLILKIEKVTQTKGSRRRVQKLIDRNQDLLYHHFLQEFDSRDKRQGAYYIKDEENNVRLPIGEFIAQKGEFDNINQWRDIFSRVLAIKKFQAYSKQNINAELKHQKENAAAFMKLLDDPNNNVALPVNQICCAPFFYYDMDILNNFVNQGTLLVNRKVTYLTDPKESTRQITQICKDICALLNTGGGIILFNTFKRYLEIHPKGEPIIQSEFNYYIQVIQRQMSKFYPKINENNIKMSFVPVVRNPFTHGVGQKDRKYIEGVFIFRLVVVPSQSEQMYCYKSSDENYLFSTVVKGKVETHHPRNYVKLMKKRHNFFYISQDDYADETQRLFLAKPFKFIRDGHICKTPEVGRRIFKKAVDSILTPEEMEQKYKYLTLLVANKNHHESIKDKLRSKEIECDIAIKYGQYKFKAANNSAALFHNVKFDQLLAEIAYNKEFEYDGRYILTILVTEYIRLADRTSYNLMPEDDFQSLEQWLQAEHPKEKLAMWRFENDNREIEFYIKTESKLSSLFMYYVLNHYSERSVFKNPKGLEKLGEEEKKRRFKIHFPRKSRT